MCSTTSSCGTDFTCDTGIGLCFGSAAENAIGCVIGTTRCPCSKPPGYVGVCQDQWTMTRGTNTADIY